MSDKEFSSETVSELIALAKWLSRRDAPDAEQLRRWKLAMTLAIMYLKDNQHFAETLATWQAKGKEVSEAMMEGGGRR